ncbi:hypothetical protein [Pantoea agglomerans]|uniref:InvB/SpaK family type III secretion system chaperone n=1 Tax=Enterobacter agglomerans TaxID=549 RepID=UPI0013BC12BC|nr:hypothetical protein [Pantoea agglomerans]NEG59858.1 hypothetical protein [Pantoea agglomerans]NEG98827.1 hypothetical protein [Pantoea agglomerans]NEH05189.1 hypothetical protein [Pantoea agglomerans]NEH16178.1 hypothetical protein [Pantoea agglomerans]
MAYDVATLVSEMLREHGMENIIEDDLSNHSTISLSMKEDIPTINIKTEDNTVWVWAKITDNTPVSFDYCSNNLVPLMLENQEDYFIAGQPCLYITDEGIELRAIIEDKNMQSADVFQDMLGQFLDILQNYRTVLL